MELTLFAGPLGTSLIDSDLKKLYEPALEKVEKQLEAAVKELNRGKSAEDVLRQFSRRATNTLIHKPTMTIKDQDDSALIKKLLGI